MALPPFTLLLQSGKIPMWAMALVGGKGVGAWVLEESEVGPALVPDSFVSCPQALQH